MTAARYGWMATLLVIASVGTASSESEWLLWVKSENLWGAAYEKSSAGRILGRFLTKDECRARMHEVMDQIAAWNNGHSIPTTRDGDTLHLQIPSPPRLGAVNYACIPNTS